MNTFLLCVVFLFGSFWTSFVIRECVISDKIQVGRQLLLRRVTGVVEAPRDEADAQVMVKVAPKKLRQTDD